MKQHRNQHRWTWKGLRWSRVGVWRGVVVGLLVLSLGLAGCGDRPQGGRAARLTRPSDKRFVEQIVEVAPPAAIQDLRQALNDYQPQVQILSPKPDQTLETTEVSVRFAVQDLPIYKDDEFGLGPHLQVTLDNQPPQEVYDLSQPLVFTDLTPGTHTLRTVAMRPWHESFKNAGAYAQTTFNIFTETPENNPAPDAPVLTYSRPVGTYGAEPILLDFYLANAPLHVIAQQDATDAIPDWKLRCTINGQSFTFDSWEPIYLSGFQSGLNWVKLELLDESENLIPGPFNGTARLIEYEPGREDVLSKLIRGDELPLEVRRIVDPNYVFPEPVVEPEEELPEASLGEAPVESTVEDEESAIAPPVTQQPALEEPALPENQDAAEPEPITEPEPDEAAASPEPEPEPEVVPAVPPVVKSRAGKANRVAPEEIPAVAPPAPQGTNVEPPAKPLLPEPGLAPIPEPVTQPAPSAPSQATDDAEGDRPPAATSKTLSEPITPEDTLPEIMPGVSDPMPELTYPDPRSQAESAPSPDQEASAEDVQPEVQSPQQELPSPMLQHPYRRPQELEVFFI